MSSVSVGVVYVIGTNAPRIPMRRQNDRGTMNNRSHTGWCLFLFLSIDGSTSRRKHANQDGTTRELMYLYAHLSLSLEREGPPEAEVVGGVSG